MLKIIGLALILVIVASVPVVGGEFAFTIDLDSVNQEFASTYQPVNDWDTLDTTLEWTNIILTAIDVNYTVRGANYFRAHDYVNYEVNPIVGNTPTDERVIECAIGWILLRYGISKILPEKWRTAWQLGNISLSVYCINTWIAPSQEYGF